MLLRLLFLAIFVVSFQARMTQAQDYTAPSWPNLVRTMVRFNALSLSDPSLLDEYAVITECDLYKAFYSNDFKWNEVRQAVLKSVQQNIATFPVTYHYDVSLQLDRYDFAAKTYRLTAKTALNNVNTFVLYSVEGTGCGAADVKLVPRIFRAVLAQPFYIDSLPLGEKDAETLLKQMGVDKNDDHIVYTRFNLRVVYIEALRKEILGSGEGAVILYKQSNIQMPNTVRFDVRLESVNFYEDPEHTKLIYQFQP